MKFWVRCIECLTENTFFTVGKKYLWDDGVLVDDTNFRHREMVRGQDVSKWDLSENYKFEKCDPPFTDNKDDQFIQIYNMLLPKFEKNRLYMEYEHEIKKMIGLAYKSGYERGIKKRPFILGEKKDTKINIGDIVKFIDEEAYKKMPRSYPPVGTEGIVKKIGEKNEFYLINWKAKMPTKRTAWWADKTKFIKTGEKE